MNLSFSQKYPKRMGELAGRPNYFPFKVQYGLAENNLITEGEALEYHAKYQLGIDSKGFDIPPFASFNSKIHTIREDKKDRWKAGKKIHFIINNRTKDRFQFAPIVECTRIQEVTIFPNELESGVRGIIIIDEKELNLNNMYRFSINDGFPDLKYFFKWFNEDCRKKIIHWTDLKY